MGLAPLGQDPRYKPEDDIRPFWKKQAWHLRILTFCHISRCCRDRLQPRTRATRRWPWPRKPLCLASLEHACRLCSLKRTRRQHGKPFGEAGITTHDMSFEAGSGGFGARPGRSTVPSMACSVTSVFRVTKLVHIPLHISLLYVPIYETIDLM